MPGRIHLWRVEKERFAGTARAGEGARIAGGRWNSAGHPAIYCSQSLALAVLEIVVHAVTPAERADPRVWFELTMPGTVVRTLPPKRLPAGWNDPMPHPATAALGDAWLRGGQAVALRVPSSLVPGEWNYLLNPLHPRFRQLVRWARPRPLTLDHRLVRAGVQPDQS
jgi:RES domain-containing protein